MNTLGMIAIVIDDYDLAITHYVNTGSSLGLSYNYDNIPTTLELSFSKSPKMAFLRLF